MRLSREKAYSNGMKRAPLPRPPPVYTYVDTKGSWGLQSRAGALAFEHLYETCAPRGKAASAIRRRSAIRSIEENVADSLRWLQLPQTPSRRLVPSSHVDIHNPVPTIFLESPFDAFFPRFTPRDQR